MPELPEVETIKRGLAKRLIGDAISSVNVRVARMFVGDPMVIINSAITNVRRIAKVLVIDFKNGKSLIVHLKMTGQLIYVKLRNDYSIKPPLHSKGEGRGEGLLTGKTLEDKLDIAVGGHPEKAYESPLPHKHTHLVYQLSSGATLYYNDLRKFGWHKVIDTARLQTSLGQEFAGVDILSPDFTFNCFVDILRKRANRPIKEVIMEQRHLAGLGNIYASEVLWHAKIDPRRLAKTLREKDQQALYESIKKVVDLSIEYGGSSFNSYMNTEGKKGAFLQFAEVYKTSKDSLGHETQRIKQGGRTTHFCPVCQK